MDASPPGRPSTPQFLSCDWGTSSFRLRLVDGSSRRIIAELTQPAGIRQLNDQLDQRKAEASERHQAFAEFLDQQLAALAAQIGMNLPDEAPVYISGMASSSIGWKELPYAATPFRLDGSDVQADTFKLATRRGTRAVSLVSGIATNDEMMRGEETELIGLFTLAEFQAVAGDCVVILPGTHSKHVRVVKGAVESMQTFMTGELFEVLARHSVLRVSVSLDEPERKAATDPQDGLAFVEGIQAGENLGFAGSLFRVRTRTVLKGVAPSVNRWFLNGLLIGSELARLIQVHPERPILLAAAARFAPWYRLALEHLGAADRTIAADPRIVAAASALGHAKLLNRSQA